MAYVHVSVLTGNTRRKCYVRGWYGICELGEMYLHVTIRLWRFNHYSGTGHVICGPRGAWLTERRWWWCLPGLVVLFSGQSAGIQSQLATAVISTSATVEKLIYSSGKETVDVLSKPTCGWTSTHSNRIHCLYAPLLCKMLWGNL